jgi:hypothetical protein
MTTREETREIIREIAENMQKTIDQQAARILNKMCSDEVAKHGALPRRLARAICIAALPAVSGQYEAESLKSTVRAVRRIDNARQYTLSEAEGRPTE